VNGLVPPLLPGLQSRYGLSDVGAAWVMSAFSVARLAIDLPAGYIADRFGRRTTFVAGALLLTAGTFLTGLAPGPAALYLGRALAGFGHALTVLVMLLVVMASAPARVRSRTASVLEATVILSFMGSGLLAGPLESALGLRGALVAAGGASLVAALAGTRLPWDARVAADPPPRGAGSPVPKRGRDPVGPVFAAGFADAFAWAGIGTTLMPLVAASRFGLDTTAIGQALGFAYLGDLLALGPVAFLADRTSGWGVLAGVMLVSAASSPLVVVAPTATVLAPAMLVLGTTFASWPVPPAILLRAVPPESHARTLAVYRFTTDLGFVTAPVLLAFAYERSAAAAAVLASAVPLSVAVWILVVRRMARPG
jgi:MFS family permease